MRVYFSDQNTNNETTHTSFDVTNECKRCIKGLYETKCFKQFYPLDKIYVKI